MTKATAKISRSNALAQPWHSSLELVCATNNFSSLKAAVDNGADCVQLEYQALVRQHFLAGHHRFSSVAKSIRYAHQNRCKVVLSLDMPDAQTVWERLRDMIDVVAKAGIDAVLVSDLALMLYIAGQHPQVHLHYAGLEPELHAIRLLQKQLGVSRIVLPSVISLAQARTLVLLTSMEFELIGFGAQNTIVQMRRASSTELPLRNKATSDWAERCAIVENASNDSIYRPERAPNVHSLELLPQLVAAGIRAIRIDLQGYEAVGVAHITRIWREAIDCSVRDPDHYSVKPEWVSTLRSSTSPSRRPHTS